MKEKTKHFGAGHLQGQPAIVTGQGGVGGRITASMQGFGISLNGTNVGVSIDPAHGLILHTSRLLDFGARGEFGERVLSCTPLFWNILEYAKQNSVEALHSLLPKDGRLFEELIAGTYAESGYNIVELSNRSGDGGVDVWAVYDLPADMGTVTLMDQVKMYRPDRPIKPEDVARIFGGDGRDARFSKAVLSTTGRIPASVRKEYAHKGERVTLRDAEDLQTIIDELTETKE